MGRPEDDESAPAAGKPHPPTTLERMSMGADDAFAQTIAPVVLPALGTPAPAAPVTPATKPVRKLSEMESDQTMAAPVVGDLPALPTVPHSVYKGDKEIARGGMGRIVAAEDQRLRRPVALKELIDPSPDQLGRFQREALITARLQHPGIVPVYEAGLWPSGEPFFAMKMVSGRPLDKVIAELRTLDERIALLPRIAAAADAMAYAHSQRVIHRDLKPGNILIGDFGETVVIDWGLAKDLDASDGLASEERAPRSASERSDKSDEGRTRSSAEDTAKVSDRKRKQVTDTSSTLTIAGAVMGTPAYMAPEQARGEPVDQRADVFALGAMLYHLLAGVPPYNARTATDVIAAAALGRVVPLEERDGAERNAPKDLVAIVGRAMEQDPDKRYAHAGELADELRRFMTGQLVGAHDYTLWQRLGRFVKKHRAAVTISALSVVAFAVFGTLAIRQIVEQRDLANEQRMIAESRRVAAEKLIDKMLTDVKDRLQQIGRLDVLSNLGGEIRDYYTTIEKILGDMPSADGDRMAKAVDIVGLAERDSGQLDRALATWTEARDKLARQVSRDSSGTSNAKTLPQDTRFRRMMLARFDFEIGTIHQARGKVPAAITSFTEAKKQFDKLREEAPRDRQILLGAAETHDKLGDLLRNQGKIDAALEEYLEAKSERELAGSSGASRPPEDILALSTSHIKLGSVYLARGESAAALQSFKSALHLRETLLETQPDNVEVLKEVIAVQTELADVQRQLGDDKGAIQTYRDMTPTSDQLARRDPSNTVWHRDRGNLKSNLGFALLDVGEFAEGLQHLELAIETQKALVAKDEKALAWQGDLSRSYLRSGDGYVYGGDVAKAITYYEQSLEIRTKLSAADPKSAPYRRSVSWAHTKLGNAFASQGRTDAAIESHEKALALREKLVAEAAAHTGFKNELASTEIMLGKLVAPRDAKRAGELVERGLTRARQLVEGDAVNVEWKETLTQGLIAKAEVLRITGDRDGRAALLEEARVLADAAVARAPQNAHWPGYVAEIHAGLAESAKDPKAAAAEWKLARDTLEPLAQAKRLPATRKALLERARAMVR
jgi:serine/threonine protein kinase/tetratricopeptide (TPR) repeat protein